MMLSSMISEPTLAEPPKWPPDRPPDGGGGRGDNTTQSHMISFRDKLMGGKVVPVLGPRVDLITKKLVRIESEKGNPLLPKILVADSVKNKLKVPWEDALLVKLLGKNVGYTVMQNKLKNLWKPVGGMDIMDVGYGSLW